ncbi:MAG: DUF885 domain-containing protein [Acidimicrobiia bacterium]|jgi:uncharacterized protein (DUF885 family)
MADAFGVADRFVDELVALTPTLATSLGIPGFDDRWDDVSPDGHAARADLATRTRAELTPELDHPDQWRRHAARVLDAWLAEYLERYDHRDHQLDLSHMTGPFHDTREIFDIAPAVTAEHWEAICARLETVGGMLAGYRDTLEQGRSSGRLVARRQVVSVLDQAAVLTGERSSWSALPEHLAEAGSPIPSERLASALDEGRRGVTDFASYLEQIYLPSAPEADGVGLERYLRAADEFLGMTIDPDEVYHWGWDEIDRIRSEMRLVGERILPGGSIREVADLLESDPARAAPTREAFLAFVQERQDRALAELDGPHFDVDPRIRTLTVNLAAEGGALGAYYLPPSEDFSRPGGIWYAIPADQQLIPLYQEVSTAYHEGFPGHHLQVGTSLAQGDRLSRAHRALIWYSGYGEGWALYTERLMDELGYFELPEYRFGMLASQLLRACRVVVDLGCHLDLPIPEAAPAVGGGRWDFDQAVRMMSEVALQLPEYAVSEVTRYLGWPGQAISYKVGEREILGLRDEDRRRRGASFDLADFHRRLLTGGEVRLDMLTAMVLA